MAPTYDAVLFDLDGTLTDPAPGMLCSLRYALGGLGLPDPGDDVLRAFIGPPLLASFRRTFGLGPADAERAVALYREYYTAGALFDNTVFSAIPALLMALRAEGCILAVATAKPTVFAERILRHFDLADAFALVAGASLDSSRITKTAVIAHALHQRPDLRARRTVMVGDREGDIIGAHDHGLASIAVTYGYGNLAELTATRPTHLAATVADLAAVLGVRIDGDEGVPSA